MTPNRQRFDLRCMDCDVVVSFRDMSAGSHVTKGHGIAVEWCEQKPAEEQTDLFTKEEATA